MSGHHPFRDLPEKDPTSDHPERVADRAAYGRRLDDLLTGEEATMRGDERAEPFDERFTDPLMSDREPYRSLREQVDRERPWVREQAPDQWWFWTERWQQMEREAEADIAAGRTTTFTSAEEFLAELEGRDEHGEGEGAP